MKNLFILFLFASLFQNCFAQTSKEVAVKSTADFGKIALSVVLPEILEGLDSAQTSKLQSKVIQIVTGNGLAASGYFCNFVIYPKFAIYEANLVEGGMESTTVITCELSLYIKELSSKVIYASVSKKIKGSGKSKETALNNALMQIETSDKEWKAFIETGKEKILKYYESKCEDFIAKSDLLIKTEEYEKAIALLLTVPEELTDCHTRVQAKALEAYKLLKEKQSVKLLANAKIEFEKSNFLEGMILLQKVDVASASYSEAQNLIKLNQEKWCKKLVLKAKSLVATKDYSGASIFLKEIKAESSCILEAQEIIKDIDAKITAEEKRVIEMKQQQYQDQIKLQRDVVNCLKDIAVEYAKSQPETATYNTIIK